MPRPKPETALRRMVTELAALHAEDIGAILSDLRPRERAAVEGLLREHAAYFDEPPPPPAPQKDAFDAARLSAWLVQRLRAKDAAMTDDARMALREAAATAFPAGLFGKPPGRMRA